MTALSYLEFYIGHFSEETQRQVVEALCSGVLNLGDMSQVGRICFSWVTRFKSPSKHAAVTATISELLLSDIGYHLPGVSFSIGFTKTGAAGASI